MFNSDIRDELTEQCEVKVNYKSKSYLKLSTSTLNKSVTVHRSISILSISTRNTTNVRC